ncbi:glycoside hydrolase family 3 protein [uncultured Psychrosphaera sp.]|uniref:glycoside hydrolase family 3 protein n=1 Tax=uncultured Psychrosphaera sp. TaxID=1403522 RepID=UPI00262EA79D|nr:glycoside hydrolase family 3 protein [uncultured Psychrosphaera sp.]
MKSLHSQKKILFITLISISFITANFLIAFNVYSSTNNWNIPPFSKNTSPTQDSTHNSNAIKLALAQKIMLDLRYYCPDRVEETNPNINPCKTPMTKLPPELANMITNSNLGGIILFGDNLQNTAQIVQLTQNLQQAAGRSSSQIPLFISVDQEGGRVARLPRATSTSFSGNMAIGATYKKYGTKYATIVGDVLGKELSATGFNVNHGPNVDVNINPNNPVINVRSFGETPTTVAKLGLAQLQAMQKHNVIGTLKHFPGHGDTSVDSHTGLPRVNHSLYKIKQVDLAPFQYAIDNKQVDMIMTAHIQYPELDNSTFLSKSGDVMMKPATMSKKILTDLLRNDMGYQGLIITDALDMRGISEFFTETEAVIETFNAGTDIALMPFKIRFKQDVTKLQLLLSKLNQAITSQKLNAKETLNSFQRILAVKEKYISPSLTKQPQTSKANKILANKKHRELEQELSDNSVTLIKGEPKLDNNFTSLHLLMPDKSKCAALTTAIQKVKPKLILTCSSILNSNDAADMKLIKQANAVLAGSITPYQSMAEMGGMDDMAAFKKAFGSLSSNKKRLDSKLKSLLRYAKQINKPVTFVSLRMPYEVEQYNIYADTIIATYSYNQYKDIHTGLFTSPVYNSLAKLIAGKLTATGSLPVSVNMNK